MIATITLNQWRYNKAAISAFDNTGKRMINRRKDDHPITRRTIGIQAKADGIAKTMRIDDPVRFNIPVMAPLHPADQGRTIVTIITKITMNAVIEGSSQSRLNPHISAKSAAPMPKWPLCAHKHAQEAPA